MSKRKWVVLLSALMALGVMGACDSDDDDDSGGSSGSYAGTWTGNVCGRGLTLVLTQNGTSLTGSYTFTDPVFNDTCAGTVSSANPPASAILRSTGGHDFWFDIVFSSSSVLSGGYYKSGTMVCTVNAAK